MAEYGKVYKKLWRSRRFLSMSEDAQRLLLYAFTGPGSNALGLYVLQKRHLALDWGWRPKRLEEAFTELLSNCWVNYDATVELLLVHGWFEGDPPIHSIQNDNQFKRVLANLSENPRSILHQELIDEIADGANGIPDRYLQRFTQQLQQRLPEPLPQQSRNIVTVAVAEAVAVEEAETVTETPLSRKRDESGPDSGVPFEEIIGHLNQLTGKNLDHKSPGHRKFIRARWREGATLEQFFHVNTVKAMEWLGTKREKYLRPKTLYNSENFDGYCNEREIPGGQLSERARNNRMASLAFLKKHGVLDGEAGQGQIDLDADQVG